MSPELRTEWVCVDCGNTRCRNACGDPIPEPTGWKDGRCWDCVIEEVRTEKVANPVPFKERAAKAEAILRADPDTPGKKIAAEVEIAPTQVSRIRKLMGLPPLKKSRAKAADPV